MPDRTQDLTNHRKVATACKNYTDTQIGLVKEEIYWHIGEYSVTTSDDNTSASVKTVPSGATRCKIKRVYGNSVKYAPSTASDDTTAKDKSIPSNTYSVNVDSVGGMSYKYNQLVQNGNFTDTSNWGNSSVVSSVSNNIASFTATAQNGQFYQSIYAENTHKYLAVASVKTTTATTDIALRFKGSNLTYTTATTNWQVLAGILTVTGSANTSVGIQDTRSSDWDNIETTNIQLFDLTAMGIDTTDVATATTELLKRGIDINQYNEYSVGTIRDTVTTTVKFTGSNLWDEQWELGGYHPLTGEKTVNNTIRSVDYIKVDSNTTYYFKTNGFLMTIAYYDKNKNFIAANGIVDGTRTTQSNCDYITFFMNNNYGTTYNNDICIYINPITKQIPAEVQALEGYGWGVNDTCYNYIDFETKKFVKKVGRVDLGSFNYIYFENQGNNSIFETNLVTAKVIKPNLLCSLYSIKFPTSANTDDLILGIEGSQLRMRNTAYTDTTAFKSAMNGVYLYYELATPVETDISSYLTDFNPITTDNNYTDVEFVNQYNADMPNKVSFYGTIKETLCTAIEQRRNGTLIKTITLSSNTADYGYSDNVSANVRDYTTNTGTLNVGKRAYESGDEEDSDIKTDELNVSYYPLATPTTESITSIENIIEVQAGDTLTFVNENNQAVPSDLTYRIEVER